MNPETDIPQLFQHSRRPNWGLAILAWEGKTRRRYQFQDGRLRTFKKGFYHLFEPVDKPFDVSYEIATSLESQLDVARARRERMKRAKKRGRKLIPFKEQVKCFLHLFPGGFSDPQYLEDVRGEGVPRRRKRHRDPAIEQAQDELSKAKLDKMMKAKDWAGIRDAAQSVMKRTDLLRPKEVKPLGALFGDQLEAYARALYSQLYEIDEDNENLVERFQAVVDALESTDKRVTWPTVTTLPALVHPDDHVAIKPTVFREQARWMAPRLKFDLSPSGKMYRRLLGMSFTARRRMQQQDLEPTDMLDVHQFIWATLRPKGRKLIKKLRKKAIEVDGKKAEGDDKKE